MKKLKLKLALLITACLCMVGFAAANDKKDKEDAISLVCAIYPAYCGATTQGGNGGGVRPPPPPPPVEQ